jgi:hypothetical protein
MSNELAARRVRVVLALVAISIAGTTDCLPATVAWLPDSGGFVYQGDEQGT